VSDPIRSIANPAIRLNILADEDVGRIHAATLDLIDSVGVRFPSERALDILEAHGAQVDRVTMIARVPGHAIEESLAKAPPVYALSALDPQLDLPPDGHHATSAPTAAA
jgi:trimethylamine--corrinoid protein Co-methyltransferase